MQNYYNENLLEMVEMYAEEKGLISNEEELSKLFDDDIVDDVIVDYGNDDIIAINVAFNNQSDSLCKDGIIHPVQYNAYCYVGKYSE